MTFQCVMKTRLILCTASVRRFVRTQKFAPDMGVRGGLDYRTMTFLISETKTGDI
jgi:hypothetical protein